MNQYLKKLDKFFSDVFLKRAPQMPSKKRDLFAGALPWIVLVIGIGAAISLLKTLNYGLTAAPYVGYIARTSGLFSLSWLVFLVEAGLEIVAIPYLFKHKKLGWLLLYYSSLLGLGYSVLVFSGVGFLVGVLVLYLLYQVKGYYK